MLFKKLKIISSFNIDNICSTFLNVNAYLFLEVFLRGNFELYIIIFYFFQLWNSKITLIIAWIAFFLISCKVS